MWSLVDSLISVFHTFPKNLNFDILPNLKSKKAHQELSLNINVDSSDAKTQVIAIGEAMKQLGFNITTANRAG